jgi:hypothetical protein
MEHVVCLGKQELHKRFCVENFMGGRGHSWEDIIIMDLREDMS